MGSAEEEGDVLVRFSLLPFSVLTVCCLLVLWHVAAGAGGERIK